MTEPRIPDGGAYTAAVEALVALYTAARESLAYNRSLKLVDDRRAFRPTLIGRLTAFLETAWCPEARRILDEWVCAPVGAGLGRLSAGTVDQVASIAQRADPEGWTLLVLKPPLTLEHLKSAYRAAAMRYHPDRGGDTRRMQRVNAANQLFTEILCRSIETGAGIADDTWLVPAQAEHQCSAADILHEFSAELIDAYPDDFAVDKALPWIDRLLQDPSLSPPRGQPNTTWADWFERVRRLALRLAAAGLQDDSRRFLALLKRPVASELWFFANLLAETAESIEDGKVRLVITSRAQAENAFRLGMIDRRRYEVTLERLGAKRRRGAARDHHAAGLLDGIAASGGFVALRDLGNLEVAEPSGLVPEPGYGQTSPEDLIPVQRREYHQAFADRPRLNLVRKYAFVRLEGIIRAAFLSPDSVPIGRLREECLALAEAKARESPDPTFLQVADLLEALAASPPEERRARSAVLAKLDEHAPRQGVTVMVFDLSGAANRTRPLGTLRVCASSEFLDGAMVPVPRLEHLLQTGS